MQFKNLAFAALASVAIAQQTPDLAAALNSTAELSSLATLLSAFPDLTGQLAGLTNVTLLAPSNDAIAAFQNASAAALNDTALVEAVLLYHVLQGTYANFTETAQFIPTALQPGAYANVTGGQVVEAITTDGNATFFTGFRANSSAVAGPVNYTGGVVHVIDRVLTLPASLGDTAVEFNLSSIVGALTAVDLVAPLESLTDITVFVPNNDAFQSIGSALPNLTAEEITAILGYHYIEGTVAYSADLMNMSLPTGNGTGPNITITIFDDVVFVNNARVVRPDVLIANGVVHVIDEVLNPNNATAPNATATAGEPAFSGASSASDVPYTSGVPTATGAVPPEQTDATATGSAGAGWMVKPTNLGAVLLGGAAIAFL